MRLLPSTLPFSRPPQFAPPPPPPPPKKKKEEERLPPNWRMWLNRSRTLSETNTEKNWVGLVYRSSNAVIHNYFPSRHNFPRKKNRKTARTATDPLFTDQVWSLMAVNSNTLIRKKQQPRRAAILCLSTRPYPANCINIIWLKHNTL